jgi:hypothetical protein
MKNKNVFVFSWDHLGIESIISVTEYDKIDKENIWKLLKGETPQRNPINNIVQMLLLRAKFNPQRHYEIYAVDCDYSLDKEFWKSQWDEFPQETADLIRECGHKIYSDRLNEDNIKIR